MSDKTAEDYLKEPYERVLIPEEEGFLAYIAEFEGCHASGQTADEAIKNLEAVAKDWIEAETEKNQEIPPAWNAQTFSGHFSLRLPKSLHQELARLAEREGASLNQYMVAKLSCRAGEDRALHLLAERLSQTPLNVFVNLPDEFTYEGSKEITWVGHFLPEGGKSKSRGKP